MKIWDGLDGIKNGGFSHDKGLEMGFEASGMALLA